MEAFPARQAPQSATRLLGGLTLHWADKPDGRNRQIQMQATSRWATSRRWRGLCTTRVGNAPSS